MSNGSDSRPDFLPAREIEAPQLTAVPDTSMVLWRADSAVQTFTIVGGRRFLDSIPSRFSREEGLAPLHPDDRDAANAQWQAAICSKTPFEAIQRMFDSRYGWRLMHTLGTPVLDGAGEIVEWLGVSSDITQQSRAENALHEANRLYGQLLASLNVGIVVFDTDLRYLIFNPFMERLRGVSASAVIGKHPWEAFPSLDGIGLRERLELALTGAEAPELEYKSPEPTPTGTPRFISQTFFALHDEHRQIIGVVSTLTDISARKLAEETIRDKEARFRAFMDHSPAAAWITDQDGRLVFVSGTSERMFQLPSENVIGKSLRDLYPPHIAQVYMDNIHKVAQTGEVLEAFEPGVRVDGTIGEFWVFRFPIPSPDGTLIGGKAIDVTERKTFIRALHQTEAKLATAVSAANVGLWDWNLDTNEVVYSQEWKAQLGLEEHEIGNDLAEWRRLIHAADVDMVTSKLERYLADPKGMHQVEFRMKHRDGSYRWILAQGRLLDDTDGVRRMVGSHIDITAQVGLSEALRLRDRAIQRINQGIIIVDAQLPDQPMIYVSPGFERLTGYAQDEVLGKNCRFLQGDRTDPGDLAKLRAALKAGEPITLELINYRKDGSAFWNELSVAPVQDGSGRLTHFVGMQNDVTERRALEEQLRQSQKMEAVGQLAGGVAHDFNNLLTIIGGSTEILQDMLNTRDPAHEWLDEIQRASERAGALTRQLLIFSRRQVVDSQVISLNAVLDKTQDLLRRLIGEHIVLIVKQEAGLGSVHADVHQLEQVLMNLAVNARDAMPRGGRLTLATQNVLLDPEFCLIHTDVRPGEYVLLTVTDEGIGMDALTLAHAFEPFFTTKAPGQGTGLGLATVHSIVRQSGGLLTAKSEVGHGCTFSIYLPRVSGLPDAGEPLPEAVPLPRGHETVLLVEDEDAVRNLALRVLQSCGYKVMAASDGVQAMELARKFAGQIDLLLSDVVMPNLGGRALADQIRKVHPHCRVLLISGYIDDAVTREGIRTDDNAFLQKPFTPSVLARKVRDLLDGSDNGQ